jgi:hypothetical protein
LFLIYRPPASRSNTLKTTRFFEEWLDFLDYTMHIPEDIIITCDLNFHLDNKSDCDGRKFIEMLSDRGLVQHVIGATPVSGHTLDVIISRDNSPILIGTSAEYNSVIGRSVMVLVSTGTCMSKTDLRVESYASTTFSSTVSWL